MNRKILFILVSMILVSALGSASWFDSKYEYRHNITQTNTSHSLLGSLNGTSPIDEGFDSQGHWIYGTWKGENSENMTVYHQDQFHGGWNQTNITNGTHEYCVIQTVPKNYTACNSKPDGLVGFWTLDENGGKAWDHIGKYHGETKNGVTQNTAGKIGKAYSFDGTDDYVNLSAFSQFSSYTVSTWVNPENIDDGNRQKIATFRKNNNFALFKDTSNNWKTFVSTDQNTYVVSSSESTVNDNWTHLVSRWDGSSLKLYVNGKEVASTSTSGSMASGNNGNSSKIGAFAKGDQQFWNGSIDQLRLYNRSLSSSEIKALYYNKASPGAEELSFAGGNGTSSNPYQIDNVHQLQRMEGNKEAVYELVSDINATETKNWNSGKGFDPIGGSVQFNGSFYGNNYTISNLTIDRPSSDYSAIFGWLSKATVRDVDVVGVRANGSWGASGLAGYSNKVNISNIYVSGVIEAKGSAGGIITGLDWKSKLEDSVVDANITGGSWEDSGGVIGWSYEPVIENVTVYGNVKNSSAQNSNQMGGIVGNADNTNISNSEVYADVKGSYQVGGFIGDSDGGVINNSEAYGNVSGIENVGGLVGRVENTYNGPPFKIINSEAYGNISGNWSVGGVAGKAKKAEIISSTGYGNIYGREGGDFIGGLVGSAVKSEINASDAHGNVFGKDFCTGGLVGNQNKSDIYKSFATGNVDGEGETGGLIGCSIDNGNIIKNTYATGNVSGTDKVGGLAGSMDSLLNNSYARGNVTGNSKVGGLVGDASNNVSNSYWDTEKTGQSNAIGSGGQKKNVEGLNTSQMTGSDAEGNMTAFDFTDIWEVVSGVNDNYPVLQVFGFSSQGSPSISLSWKDNSESENGFEIIQNASGSFQKVAEVGQNVESATDDSSSLDSGEYVCYRVKAFNRYGSSKPAKACITVP